MVKRKSSEGQEQDSGRGIPLPIQTFLWRQTSAFLRPKLGKQYEASCVSFERVLVENKLHGLSPALSEAIQSISRWELVQAALPHVLHCTATLLSNRNKLGHQDKLGVAETKLLHTLHWMLLEAPQDCNSERFGGTDRGSSWGGGSSAFIHQVENQGSPGQPCQSTSNDEEENNRRKIFQNSMATVELFVFLFAPLVHRIKESDLTFRLASGLVIWQPMWEHRQPEVSGFTALVKPIRNIITAKRSSPINSQSQTCESPNQDTRHREDLTMKCNEEEKSLSPEAFSKVSLTNLRRSAIPDLSSDLGMNIFKKVIGLYRCKFCIFFASPMNRGKFTRRGSSDAATEMESLSARHSHSHHTLVSDLPDHSNSHGENIVKEVRSQISTITVATFNTTLASFNVGYADFFSEHMRKLCNQVVLKAVYLVLNHDISSRICDVALNIVECLLQLGVVPCVEKNRKKSENKENGTVDKRPSEGTFQFKGVSGSSTCGFGGPTAQNCLTKLYKLDKMQFRQTMRDYVNKDSLNNVVDFLHALLGFCMEPVTDNKAGFGNNFTTVDNKSTAQNVEGIVVSAMFKSLITRCASTTHELHSPENLGLYCDIRQLVQFIKEAHGNVFRRVALSALLDSAEKLAPGKKVEENEPESKPGRGKRSEAGSVVDKGQVTAAPEECRSFMSGRPSQTPEHDEQMQGGNLGRKDFWRKMFKSQSAASDTSSQSEQDTSECTTAHSGTTSDRRARSRSRRISLRKKLKLPIGNWLKRSSLSGLADGVEDLLDISSVDRLSFIRQSSKVKFTSAVKLSEGGPGSGMENGRDEEENFFKRLGCHSFDDHLPSNQDGGKSKNVVNLGAIRQGMKRFQFLLNCCEPGTIPDASILAAALDLEAPVVARAALFLECARFVHRCNRGNWPEWMKGHHVNITKKGLSRGRSPIVGNKRNQKLQWNAAKLFYQWGDAIGVRLNELCHGESESPANLLGLIYDEETKRRLRKEDEEEDFLDDSTVNPSKCGCPFALKMAACQLLLEITTFLRETFSCLPRPRTEPLMDLESCRLRLDPELDRHRYERKISFAGVLDENEDSKDSLHSSSHTLKSDAGVEEKKVPSRKIRIGGSRLLQIKGTRSFQVKKGGSLSSIRRVGSLKSSKLSRQDSESEAEELQLSQSRDTVTDLEGSPWSASEPSIEPEGMSTASVEENYHRNMSWLHVMILLCNQQSFICTHIDYCHPHCYLHHSRSCARLVRAIKLLYGDTVDSLRESNSISNVALRGKKQKECSDKSCLRTPSLKKRVSDANLEGKKDSGMLKYIRLQVMSLSPAPLSLLIKAAPILTEEMYGDIQPAAWELLLSMDEHMAGAAAAMFLLCAVKVPEAVSDMLTSEFHHPETVQRLNAVLKFHTLWRFRYQVWPRMEEGAQQIFKIPPPSINFTLPSPVLGMPSVPMFDPPWVPQCSGSVQDPINEDQSKSFSARAVSRSHQRAEHILKNLQQEEEKKRLGREASLITAIPITQEACYEPTCTPNSEPEEEVEEVTNLASRRLSVSPSCTSSTSHRNYSFRRGSVWSVRSAVSAEDEEHTTEHTPNHHVPQPPQAVFPACICAAVLPIVHLMEDGEVREDGVAVSAVAQQVLWNCLIEDPSTVLRHFLEKLTISNRQDELMYMLRKLLLNIGDFPAQTSHILFNYLVGLIMYFVRTPCEWGMDAISATLTFLWEVVGYVEGLFFKDLKQTMKKEQCEVKLLVTASMPGTKTLVVHGQNECDIPTQLPVHEDTQFEALLKECLEFFNIPESQSTHYFLMDKRWNLIHYNKVFTRKLEEVGRVLFLISLTQKIPTAHKQSHVSMLQEDLLRLPSFPRSAIDAEFSLFSDPQAGKELFGLDTLQKSLWIQLLEEMFLGMPSEFPWGDEIMLFLNVFNGALILHPEDSALLRQYAATVINSAVHFNHLFSLSGYQWILPTMLQVYSDYESNPQLRQAIEFACHQFYILHRKPFVLQLFASVAPLLEFPDAANTGSSKGVSAQCLFDLLQSLEGETTDILDILELVKAEKPLKSLDFCYGNEDLTFSISEAIKLCVTVVAYAPESFRSLQMLMVLEALVPCYLQKLKRQTSQVETVPAAREEIAAMAALATSLQALLYSVEVLTRPMTAPQMSRCDQGHKGATTANHTMSSGVNTRYQEQGAKLHFIRENLHLLEEGQGLPREELDERIAREEFRRPRESLLNICTEFYKHCGPRLKILQNLAGEPRVTALELLDVKSHMRLAEIAHSLLKLAPYDTQTMESRGLRRYIMEMLPITDWSAEAVRPALILILKRLDRMFNKIHKMPTLSPWLEQPEVQLLLQTVINVLLPPRIISTSRSKNFMLESSPAHCSTPGDASKDLRKEGLAESTSQAAYLALKVILVCFERQLGSQWYWLSLQVKEMALRKVGGLALWDFLDFIVRTRIPIFVLLRPFIQCKVRYVLLLWELLAQPAENHEELSARQHIADQLERRFIPRPLCKSSLIAEFNSELKILKEAVHSGSAYQGKTSISTVGTSTSAYRLSLATMSRSNTGTGTVWEQDSEPSQQASQDTLSRTDEEDEENDSVSMPSVVSEQEAYLLSTIGRRRFSSHVSSMSAPQAELRRPLLSRQKTQTEPRNRHGARLSTTRRSIQPKTKPSADQKRSVTFIEAQPEPAGAPTDTLPATGQPQGCSPAPSRKPEGMDKPVLTSSPAIVVADLHSLSPKQGENLPAEEGERKEDTEVQGATAHSPLSTQLSDPDDFTGLETSILLQHGDTVLHISEENGMENPLLASQFPFTPTERGETDVDLDESHV
ncbi:hypothetical protein JEQ12_009802 [Ovis aries]|uniref:Protein unc-80 homolog n=1 Tax=Ovis aries TaxID=9940 RepID=A0A836ABT2_SHEEP|nr:hypothetical protein JEQ12_009802 [Ovis aries]